MVQVDLTSAGGAGVFYRQDARHDGHSREEILNFQQQFNRAAYEKDCVGCGQNAVAENTAPYTTEALSLLDGVELEGLQNKLNNREGFAAFLMSVYGDSVDAGMTEAMRQSLLVGLSGHGEASRLPQVTFLPDVDMRGASGAYFAGDDKTHDRIFLNESLLAGAQSIETASAGARRDISTAVMEELGHALESRLSSDGLAQADTPGDEGAAFVYRLTGGANMLMAV